MESNSDFDIGMFGNWVQILEKKHTQKKIIKNHFDRRNQPPNDSGNESPLQDQKVKDTRALEVMSRWLNS
jgi:hypothetical protein